MKTNNKRNIVAIALSLLLSGWYTATVFSQHPNRLFDKIRGKLGPFSSVLPNWRFFAPNPAQHDFHILYRTLDHDGTTSTWQRFQNIPERKWYQAFFFYERRNDKALFDATTLMLGRNRERHRPIETTFGFTVIDSAVRQEIWNSSSSTTTRGYQFAIIQAAGFDESVPIDDLFRSGFREFIKERIPDDSPPE